MGSTGVRRAEQRAEVPTASLKRWGQHKCRRIQLRYGCLIEKQPVLVPSSARGGTRATASGLA